MNWYKAAEAAAVAVTPERFRAMTFPEKMALAKSSTSPLTQRLFFTEEYGRKDVALWDLAGNEDLTPEVQSRFITEEYSGKYQVLCRLAENTSIHPETQLLFFTKQDNGVNKDSVLRHLANNPSITLEAQQLLLTGSSNDLHIVSDHVVLEILTNNQGLNPQMQSLMVTDNYRYKSWALLRLARNESIAPETQRLLFTERYNNKKNTLEELARNKSIIPEVQRLLLAESYEGKDSTSWYLMQNKNFLRDFTSDEWLKMRNAVRGSVRLHVLSKRLEQIAGVP